MSIVRALSHLVTQGPSKPARSLVDRRLVERRRHHHVPTTWIDVEKAADATIVHLHGGGYLRGADQNTWEWLEDLRRRSGTAAAMVHYRVAPRYPFPYAFDDALQAVLSLTRNSVVRPGRWVLSGDGAGGGLALAVAQSLREYGGGEPALLMLTTPWLDLSEERLRSPELREAACVVVAAGMDGALPTVVAGQISAPVVALPTSVGYGVAAGGVTAALTMLSACAPGVGVVNIDNGYGAGHLAAQIARWAPAPRESGEPGSDTSHVPVRDAPCG